MKYWVSRASCASLGLLALISLIDPERVWANQSVDPALQAQIKPRVGAREPVGPSLIEKGRRLFTEETFGGNGRTCATCHPADNNFTIDTAFIATLPPRDPLFVAEFNPKLRDLEIPELHAPRWPDP